ncbi:MAG TPA: NUDIX hydrolase [Candidatus Eisenbacteria bacterium]|nr:NUDIX hydrolase [Candidatus Eisenbacteria bacterium]
MPKKLPYRLLESRSLHRGHYVELVKDRFELDACPGKIVTRELLRHPGAVVVLPFVDRKNILLLRQFRYAAQGDLWEIPAGTMEKGEPWLRCARRELEEETGFRARRWKLLSKFYPAPGISNELMALYRADSLVPGRKNLDHDEWIEHETVPLVRAAAMIRSGKIRDAKTIVAVLWALHFG